MDGYRATRVSSGMSLELKPTWIREPSCARLSRSLRSEPTAAKTVWAGNSQMVGWPVSSPVRRKRAVDHSISRVFRQSIRVVAFNLYNWKPSFSQETSDRRSADCYRRKIAAPAPPTTPCRVQLPSRDHSPTNDTTPAHSRRGALGGESFAVQPLIANNPRSAFLNRDSFPFVLISRRMAL